MKIIKKLTTIIMSLFLVFLSYGAFNCYGFMEDKDIPTIEQLTNGKLKVGDTFSKEHLEILRDYLPPACQLMLERGMKGVISPQIPLEQQMPESFFAITKKNQGKAFIDDHRAIWMKTPEKEKDYWKGGLPFWPNPQTGLEAMENHRFARQQMSDAYTSLVDLDYINKKGKAYKTVGSTYGAISINPRIKLPPIPNFEVYEKESYRGGPAFIKPYDVKGMLQVATRYYDDIATPDTGFLYIPALKRTLRISSTTWTDNMAGSDITYGDGAGGRAEPFSRWKFKILERDKIMLGPSLDNPEATRRPDGKVVPNIPLDAGEKFFRCRWNVRPVYVIEATPIVDHVYSKRLFYLDGQAFRELYFENYDRQGELWKIWLIARSLEPDKDGEKYSMGTYIAMYDLQKDHCTRMTAVWLGINDESMTIEDFTLKKMMEAGD